MFSSSFRSKNKYIKYENIMFIHELVLGMCFSLSNRSPYITHAEREQIGWKGPLER